MMLSNDEIVKVFERECWVSVIFADGSRGVALDRTTAVDFARAIEAKVREQDEALLRQCLAVISDRRYVSDYSQVIALEDALKARLGEA